MKKKQQPAAVKDHAFSAELCDCLKAGGLDTDGLLYCAEGDMDNDAAYCAAWLSFDSRGLYIAFGQADVGKAEGRRRLTTKYTLRSLEAYPAQEITSLKVELYVSTGRLVAETPAGQISLLRFSMSKRAEMDAFAKVYNTYRESGVVELPPEPERKKGVCRQCGAPCPPNKDLCRKHSRRSATALRLFRFFGGYVPQITVIFLVMLLAAAAAIFVPQISTRALFDNVLANADGKPLQESLKALGVLVASIFGVRLLNTLLTVLREFISGSVMPRVIYDIKVKIFDAMQRLSVSFYSSKQTGTLMDRVMRDANNIYWFFVDGVPTILLDTLTVLGILTMMFFMSVKLTLAVLLALPVMIAALVLGDRMFRRLHHRVWASYARANSMLSDSINGQRVIKAFATEDAEFERYEGLSGNIMRTELKQMLAESTLFPLMEVLVMLLSTLMLGFGSVMVARGEITTGTLLSFTVYLSMLRDPFDFLSWVSNWWARCADSAQRVFEICDAKPEITEKPDAVSFDDLQGEIELRALEFEYEPAQPVIKKLDLHVQAGQMLGIVGKTGAGKTTIANLIARLYDAKGGGVYIDGINVKDLKLTELRRNIGLVSQDIYLFSGSIADNIRYARPDAGMDEVLAAAKAAAAHDFIMKLPDAYETRVGAGGQKLSGGERQRISIARTIIQNPKILILDEATAAMDTETERRIQQSLLQLKTGRTTIAIAHRLSTLRDADQLAVIDDGQVVECGTCVELLRQRGEFYRQYKIQSEALRTIGIGEGEPDAPKEE